MKILKKTKTKKIFFGQFRRIIGKAELTYIQLTVRNTGWVTLCDSMTDLEDNGFVAPQILYSWS